MKGEAENTIVRIVIALIVLGVIVTLLYLALGPFRDSVTYNTCLAYLKQQCMSKPPTEYTPIDQGPCNSLRDKSKLPKTCKET
ncbi:MAG: hypothetical protein KQA41_03195 [Candidatus Aenigmarchaeota archaeon]|nr:hypothetical protein [Candidatus Aenigmarchaeota archaeon]MBU5689206.1 hypothetical protein [Candidatus Aenigmarchaeota archaeon]